MINVATMRMLAYGVAADIVDEYLLCENQPLKTFSGYFILDNNESFHCVKTFNGYFILDNNEDFQHAIFGLPGTLNDINMLDRSPIFHDVLEGRAQKVNFQVNGNNYNLGYYLIMEFILIRLLLDRNMHYLRINKRQLGKMLKERLVYYNQQIMRPCVIMHNMIVKDELHSYIRQFDYTNNDVNFNIVRLEISRNHLPSYEMYIRSHTKICNISINHQLQANLIGEIWNRFGGEKSED
uniref:Uncharacterized protein n=1 Tax=Lactuca sativa TaxID=4236 RepID=A0A9R1XWT9_LACSA|nr:hypothetical protein LSAT_V11C200093520 [Lactuca sativa]